MAWKSARWPRGHAYSRVSSAMEPGGELRAPPPARVAARVAVVVVVAQAAAGASRRRADERRSPRTGTGRATLDRASARLAAFAVSRRLDHRRRRAAAGLGPRRAAQRGDLDCPRHGHIEQ